MPQPDGNACTTSDVCSAGKCAPGAAKVCNDANACTDDNCDNVKGCTTVANKAPCNDGSVCTTTDGCNGGNCVAGPALACDDNNACTTDSCDAIKGCKNTMLADNSDCGGGKTCVAGVCTAPVPAGGCAPGMAFAFKLEGDLWLCAPDNITGNNNYKQVYSSCNEVGGFHMGTVSSITRRGLPANNNISAAMTWAKQQGYDYVVSGQPVRNFAWEYNKTPYESTGCGAGGLGYISTGELNGSGSNWQALNDGNDKEYREWPAANCVEVSYHTLIALCQNSLNDPKAYVYDHRWR